MISQNAPLCDVLFYSLPSVSGSSEFWSSVLHCLGRIITNTIKKFQPLAHKTLLLLLATFTGKMPICATFSSEVCLRFLAQLNFGRSTLPKRFSSILLLILTNSRYVCRMYCISLKMFCLLNQLIPIYMLNCE